MVLSKPLRLVVTAIGVALFVVLIIGFVQDVRSFDRTSGGYEPPYADYTGNPIDWATLEITSEGMVNRGYIVNVRINCTSGMMHFEALGIEVPFRAFSPRALVVHRPREACEERGFSPAF
jgi:hypothetical protein